LNAWRGIGDDSGPSKKFEAPLQTRLLLYWDYLRSSYWFVPSLMAVLALVASSAMVYIDGVIDRGWMDDVGFLYRNEPAGARELLSTVAGSMIGVAGVTFSITIVSVVYASGHYGPRVLSNFMADKGNQLTLGTFIATFLYCLMVLRTVRAADESSALGAGAFVPHVAITLALAMAVASIAVLIYFIHHVPASIHVSHVVAGIGRELEARIHELFPEQIGTEADDDDDAGSDLPRRRGYAISSTRTGFVQSIDGDGLIDLAKRRDEVIRVVKRPGDFVATGDTLAEILGQRVPDEAAAGAVRDAFAIGEKRTALQDVRFPADELVEVAVRALSPGVNDPFTAMACIGWLTSGFKLLAERKVPSELRRDDEGTVRVLAPATSFESFVDGTLSMLVPHAERDPTVIRYLRESVHDVLERTSPRSRRAILVHYSRPPRQAGESGAAAS
jgi:uncharacterized membrane protein